MDVHEEEWRRVWKSCEGTWVALTAVEMGAGPLDLSLWLPGACEGTGSVSEALLNQQAQTFSWGVRTCDRGISGCSRFSDGG